MRLNSLYKFYQQHFGYTGAADKQRIAFGRAVADCMDVLKRVYNSQDLSQVAQYGESLYPRQLTMQFLDNLRILAFRRFDDPLGSLRYYEHEIVVDASRLALSRRRGLQIASPFLWNYVEGELIFLTFSVPHNMCSELGMRFKTPPDAHISPVLDRVFCREPKHSSATTRNSLTAPFHRCTIGETALSRRSSHGTHWRIRLLKQSPRCFHHLGRGS